ncbi:SCO family protein [Aurantiacibacter aquimixticola]|uniref:SCO family protein n=1 Tax=Aurantiacibacter aquimixticola TaxID=1958945 RepID=A0A419RVU0_9SPHN|nr:SCO family protein [Aurantiacibacter aquimixticola]RJY09884.1 SCO family protein [Aurantiacibacter aquimixticola]
MSSPFKLLSLALAPLALIACESEPAQDAAPPPLYGSAVVGGFDLVGSNGEPVSDKDFAGRYQMVYFGYAYCPDVCPFDVQRMVQGYNQFAEANPQLADDVQPIFITVDPERDTPEVVGEFAANFSDNLIGLTGTPEQIEAAAANYFASYSKGTETSEGGYLMDHSRSGYLVDREGQPMALLPVEQSADAVAAELEKWVR